jgi:hypothetical protein
MKRVVFVLVAFALAALGQTFFGSIVGTVSDETGSSVPNAIVAVVNMGTSERRTAQTDAQGDYQFVNLVPGVYRIEIEKESFRRLTRDQVQVQVQAAVRVDATMQVGEVTQTLEVTSAVPLLQTEQANLSQVVEGRTVQDMALNGRNVLNLVGLVPGVVPQGSSSGNPMGNQNAGGGTNVNGWGNYQIGGGAANQSASYLDGSPLNVSYINAVILVPTTDAIQEFRVVTNNVGPEFGRFAGGIVNLTTRSGTNQIHGNLYEFLRNRVLNANNFFSNRSGIARPTFVQNQYGANVSGPVIKDKTFFLFTWEGFKYRQGIPTVTTVPTADMRTGDLSARGIPLVYDPLSVCGNFNNAACGRDSNGNPVYLRAPFPGNIIPPSRINPTSRAELFFWGLPTQSGVVNNWVCNGIAGGDQYQTNYRADHNLSDRQRLFARYTRWVGNTIPNDLFRNKIANAVYYGTDNAVLGDTYSLSAQTILDFRASYLRFISGFNPLHNGADLSQFGPAYGALQNQVTFAQYPLHQVQGFQTFNAVTARNTSDNYHLSGSLTKIAGRHTWKFGGESRRIEWYFAQTNFSSGQFIFDSGFTAQNPLATAGSGYSFASFLLGYPASGQAKEVRIAGQMQFYHGYYASDTFNVSRKLTINYGIRWEYPGAFKEKHDSATVFLPTVADPLGAKVGLDLKGPVVLTNSSLWPDRLIRPATYKRFGPRAGLAYRLNDATVIRAGYGISFLPNDIIFDNGPWTAATNAAQTNYISSLDGGVTPANSLSNPFPQGLLQPSGRNPSYLDLVYGQTVETPLPGEAYPYVQQWNFTVQRQLPGGAALEVAYGGSKGTHLPLTTFVTGFDVAQADQLSDQYNSMGSALVKQVTNPFANKVAPTAGILTASTITQGQLLRPFPQYQNLYNTSNFGGSSSYNSLQAKLEKRTAGGGTFLVAYTWSKLIGNSDTQTAFLEGSTSGTVQNWNNTSAERSLASYDVPHRLVISYVYDLPVGRGRKMLANASSVVDRVIGGWGVNGVTTFQSGFPIALIAQPTTLSRFFGAGAPRPDVLGGCQKTTDGSAQDRIGKWFNTACFAQPNTFGYGNESRTDPSLRSAGIANYDFSVFKRMAITERVSLQFRTEFFNIFNRVQFQLPGPQLGTAQFGQVTATRNQPRQIQFALKLAF